MIDVIVVLSFVSALLSLVFKNKRLSEYFVLVAALLASYPLLKSQSSIVIVAVVLLIAAFEILGVIKEVWEERRFTPIKQTRMFLFVLSIFLVLGVSTVWWWWKRSAPEVQILEQTGSGWWKVFIVTIMSVHFLSLLRRRNVHVESDK